MAKTKLLPTATVVRMAWAMTGKFSNDILSRQMADYAENDLKRIEELAQASGVDQKEKSYVTSAVATMIASLRSLENAYKGRTLNFEENDKLRKTYLDQINESLSFGKKASDFLQSLPAMTIASAGGITLAQLLNSSGISEVTLWLLGLALAAVGYLVNLYFVRQARKKNQKLYVDQDFDRDLFYDQYVNRVTAILLGLFRNLERIHKQVFNENCDPDFDKDQKIINEILAGVHTTFCPYAIKHKKEGKITPELWAQCESGIPEVVGACDLWKLEAAPGGKK